MRALYTNIVVHEVTIHQTSRNVCRTLLNSRVDPTRIQYSIFNVNAQASSFKPQLSYFFPLWKCTLTDAQTNRSQPTSEVHGITLTALAVAICKTQVFRSSVVTLPQALSIIYNQGQSITHFVPFFLQITIISIRPNPSIIVTVILQPRLAIAMKIIKHLFHIPGRRPSAIQTQLPPPPPLKKKALLIGIRTVREDANELSQKNDEAARGDREEGKAKAVPKRKKKKQRDNEGAHKESALKGPHRDVFDMRQLLIGALCHYIPFLMLEAFIH